MPTLPKKISDPLPETLIFLFGLLTLANSLEQTRPDKTFKKQVDWLILGLFALENSKIIDGCLGCRVVSSLLQLSLTLSLRRVPA